MRIQLFLFILAIGLQANAQNHAFDINQKLGRGANLGNCFEAPKEGEWGVTWSPEYFKVMADLGFNSVRIPTRWEPAARSMATPPYTINSTFFNRMDQVVQSALQNHLMVILNMHHHDALFANPEANLARYKSMWQQISEHYKSYSDSLVFELLNEPNGNLTAEKWSIFIDEGIKTIRAISPERTIEIGTPNWGGVGGLANLTWPAYDNLILTVHYYNPFQFTHQGAEWVDDDTQTWLGNQWQNTAAERGAIDNDMQLISNYANAHAIPVNIGEFGSYNKADIDSRERWTTYCARRFEQLGFSWDYWEFCAGFGFYDPVKKTLVEPLVRGLLTNPMPDVTAVQKTSVYATDFNSNTTGIAVYTQQGASATGKIENNEYKIDIAKTGALGWYIQCIISPISLEKGKTYQFEFDAYAVSQRFMNVYLAMNKDPWSNYSEYYAPMLTANKTHFQYQFKMTNATDTKARMTFDVGESIENIFLDNIEVSEITVLGLVKLNQKDFRLYPNPASDWMTIENKNVHFSYAIIDLNGKIILSGFASDEQTKIDVKELRRGFYFLEIVTDEEVARKTFIKK